MLLFVAGLGIAEQKHLALAAHRAADVDNAVDLRDFARVSDGAPFEELGHARQTADDKSSTSLILRGVLASN